MGAHEMKRVARKKKGASTAAGFYVFLLAVLICVLGVIVFKQIELGKELGSGSVSTQVPEATPKQDDKNSDISAPTIVDTEQSPDISSETVEVIETTPTPQEDLPDFEPYSVSSTLPSNLFESTALRIDEVDTAIGDYQAPDDCVIDFGYGKDYTNVKGIVTFRGNNFRDTASYGTVSMVNKQFSYAWNVSTSALTAPDGATWTGSGWVGQPLVMTWSKEERQHMNMYDWAKQADELTEVIYATMGGYVYFLELDTGRATRDALNLGFTFKGAGALDPRGYPILYLGAGYHSSYGRSRVFVINLLDCSTMYTFGNDDSYNLRGTLSYFDGSPLVDAETDQLIYPGESGIMYIIKLNTQYDKEAGTLSINPSRVLKWRYYATRSAQYYLGMEDSPVIWRGHIIMADNGGNLFCVNLNTMETVWVQDVLDDTNCTPVLELEDGHPYIYISTSFHYGWRSYTTATIPIWKIDAETGEIVWQTDYTCTTVSGVSGGVQGTLAIGKNSLSDYIYVPVARTGGGESGKLVCLNKQTGEVVWEFSGCYSWSSPVAVYDSEGNGYIVFNTFDGSIYLLDGLTGDVLNSYNLGGHVEASPIVFNNTVVIGTRSQQIIGLKLS